MKAIHPEPDRVRPMLAALGVTCPVAQGATPQLIATIETPSGRVELR